MEKIKSREEIIELSNNPRFREKIIVTTNGCFDILHTAHINLLEKAKAEGDVLIVMINSDNSIKKIKGDNRPIISQADRAKIISSLGCVDYVVIFEEETPIELLELIKPNIHVKGGGGIEEKINQEKSKLLEWGGIYKQYSLEEGFSTTNIIHQILKKYNISNTA